MRLFGFEILRAKELSGAKAAPTASSFPPSVSSVASASSPAGWWPFAWLREGFPGAWQRDIPTPVVDVMSYSSVFSCVTLIASDIAKMSLGLVEERSDGTTRPLPRPLLLRKPNHYQVMVQFLTQWLISKLTWGNTYVLLERNLRTEVVAMYILDPSRVKPLVAANGDVYYALTEDLLAGITAGIPAIPASEVIHDRFYPLFHPLVGISPIYACGLAAVQGLRIQVNSAKFFENGAALGGVLTAPGAISDETANRLKQFWETAYVGAKNVGKVAVLGDGLKFEKMTMSSTDAQLIEQLRWTAENVCAAYHVPPFKIGAQAPPAHTSIEALDQSYYSQCLQILIESIEALLDDGLSVSVPQHVQFDLDGLLRMDSATLIDSMQKAVGAGIVAPNEARRKLNLPPVKGGDTPYLQQQNYSLAALDARDSKNPAPSSTTPAPAKP